MRAVTVVVCGGGEDYSFLLGCLDRHLSYGPVVVLDTTPPPASRRFRLPSSVRWIHRPDYGRGWAEFRFADALNDVIALAEEATPEIIVQEDCDEYFDHTVAHALLLAKDSIVEMKTLHHMDPLEAVDFETEWHRRMWPARRGIRFGGNPEWLASPAYNGNPQYHPLMLNPEGLSIVRQPLTFHHHLHYCVGEKAKDHSTALGSIPGWPDKGLRIRLEGCWPASILAWKETGILPGSQILDAREG